MPMHAGERREPIAAEPGGVLPRGSAAPLSLRVALGRNALRTIPVAVTVLSATLGVAAVVMLAGSILRTYVAPNDFLRGAVLVEAQDIAAAELRADAIQGATTYRTNVAFVRGRFLDVDMWFPIQLVEPREIAPLLLDYDARVVSGRLPAAALEIAIPERLARGRGIALGDVLGGPGDFTALPLRVVGLLEGSRWIGVGSAPASLELPGVRDSLLVLTASESVEAEVAQALGADARVRRWTADMAGTGRPTTSQSDLRLLLSLIVLVNAAVASTIGGLLALLYFRQREAEFVLLSILGHGRRRLLRMLMSELGVVAAAAWAAGLAGAWVLIYLIDALMLGERGIYVGYADLDVLLYTAPLLAAAVAVAGLMIGLALLRFDPVQKLRART